MRDVYIEITQMSVFCFFKLKWSTLLIAANNVLTTAHITQKGIFSALQIKLKLCNYRNERAAYD